jgi:hypothetical protein
MSAESQPESLGGRAVPRRALGPCHNADYARTRGLSVSTARGYARPATGARLQRQRLLEGNQAPAPRDTGRGDGTVNSGLGSGTSRPLITAVGQLLKSPAMLWLIINHDVVALIDPHSLHTILTARASWPMR